MQEAEDSWWWEEDQIFHEEENQDAQQPEKSNEPQAEEEDASVKKSTRSSQPRNSLKVTSERLLATAQGFKYIRTSFPRLRKSLVGKKETLKQDLETVLQFYNEWLHHLQPKYSPEVVALQVERECKTRVMRAYFNRVKALESADEFDETELYSLPKEQNQNDNEPINLPSQATNTAEITEEMRRRIELNKFEAQQRLLRRMEHLTQVNAADNTTFNSMIEE
jgi:hypothetical protein